MFITAAEHKSSGSDLITPHRNVYIEMLGSDEETSADGCWGAGGLDVQAAVLIQGSSGSDRGRDGNREGMLGRSLWTARRAPQSVTLKTSVRQTNLVLL